MFWEHRVSGRVLTSGVRVAKYTTRHRPKYKWFCLPRTNKYRVSRWHYGSILHSRLRSLLIKHWNLVPLIIPLKHKRLYFTSNLLASPILDIVLYIKMSNVMVVNLYYRYVKYSLIMTQGIELLANLSSYSF